MTAPNEFRPEGARPVRPVPPQGDAPEQRQPAPSPSALGGAQRIGEIIEGAQRSAKQFVDEARRQAQLIVDEAQTEARQQRAEMVNSARGQLDALVRSAEEMLRGVGELSSELTRATDSLRKTSERLRQQAEGLAGEEEQGHRRRRGVLR